MEAQQSDNPGSGQKAVRAFLAEIVRRRVHRVAMAYIAIGWMALEATDMLGPLLGLPEWAIWLVLTLVTLGFPVAIILSWVYDLTSDGLVQTEETPASAQAPKFTSLIIISILLGAVAWLLVQQNVETDDEAMAKSPSIAVLAFEDLSASGDQRYFSDGVSEELLNALANVRGLKVASRTSSFQYRNHSDVTGIASELGVANILEGSVRRSGDIVRITAQLIDGRTGFHVWSDNFDFELSDILIVQDQIARQVVSAITPMLVSNIAEAPAARVDEAAYTAYLEGLAILRGPLDELRLNEAANLFQEATRLDNNLAKAHAGLCETYLRLYTRLREDRAFTSAEHACGEAMDRARPGHSQWEIHLALAELYRASGQYENALAQIDKAIGLRPDLPILYVTKGLALAGEPEAAVTANKVFQQALTLDPVNWDTHLAYGNYLYDQKCYTNAIEHYETVLSLQAGYPSALVGLGSALYMSGATERAEAVWMSLRPATIPAADRASLGNAYSNLGIMHYYNGDFARAVEMQTLATRMRPEDHLPWGRLAESYRGLGDTESEMNAYRRGIELAQSALEIEGSWETSGLLALYHAHLGEQATAERYRNQMLQLAPDNPVALYYAALTSLALGATDEAFRHLEAAGNHELPRKFIVDDPDLRSLREIDSDRFERVLATAKIDNNPDRCNVI